jgi:glutaconate CoA-transferase, subunit A
MGAVARRSKLSGLAEALATVESGSTIGIGGFWYHNSPAAAVRELLRRGVRDLVLYTPPPSSFTTDLLVGAGAIRSGYLAHVSFEHLGLAPNVRRAVESGTLDLVECDEATILGGCMATMEGLGHHEITSLKGTDHLKTSPLAVPSVAGDGTILTPAIRLDTLIIHAQEADEYGNVRHMVTPFIDALFVKVAARVIVTVDRLVSNSVVRSEPKATTIPGYLVDTVVEVPYGAHPCASQGRYPQDEVHLRRYLEMVRRGEFEEYCREFVFAPRSHDEYLRAVGGSAAIERLFETTP